MKLPECFASSWRYKNNGFVQPEWESLFVEVVGLRKNIGVGNVLLHRMYKTIMLSMHSLVVVLTMIGNTLYFTTSLLTRKLCPRHVFFGAGIAHSFGWKS